MPQIILFLITFLLASPAIFAADYFYCGNSSTYIHPGDTLDHVLKICGNPVSYSEKKTQPTKTVQSERWVYNFQPNSAYVTGELKVKQNALVVDFDSEGKAIQIQVEEKSAPKTDYCWQGKPIQLGDTKNYVYQICAYPSVNEKTTLDIPQPEALETILTYQSTPSMPTTKLIFHDKKLIAIK